MALMRSRQTSPKLTPSRPGYGTRGDKITLWANHFQLITQDSLALHRYDVQVTNASRQQQLLKGVVKRVIELLIEEHDLEPNVVSDFRSTILLREELDLPPDNYSVRYRELEEEEPPQNAYVYTVRLQHTGLLTLASLLDHSTSSNGSSLFGTQQESVQALNILLGHYNKSQRRYAVLGKGRCYDAQADDNHRSSLGAGIEAIRGFVFSVRAATSRLLVNVQIKNLAFYESGPLDRVVKAFMADSGPSHAALGIFLKRLKVDVTHIVRSTRRGVRIPRIKTIVGLAHSKDGKSLTQPPRVSRSGAGANEVEFFLQAQPAQSSKPSKKKGKAASAGPSVNFTVGGGHYISVASFFQERMSSVAHSSHELPESDMISRVQDAHY